MVILLALNLNAKTYPDLSTSAHSFTSLHRNVEEEDCKWPSDRFAWNRQCPYFGRWLGCKQGAPCSNRRASWESPCPVSRMSEFLEKSAKTQFWYQSEKCSENRYSDNLRHKRQVLCRLAIIRRHSSPLFTFIYVLQPRDETNLSHLKASHINFHHVCHLKFSKIHRFCCDKVVWPHTSNRSLALAFSYASICAKHKLGDNLE